MVKSEEEQEDDQDEELMAELTKGLSASSSSSVQLAQQPSLRRSGGDSGVAAPEKATKDTGVGWGGACTRGGVSHSDTCHFVCVSIACTYIHTYAHTYFCIARTNIHKCCNDEHTHKNILHCT